jgi:HD-GYP domain-containing protein (c-di-GMP phosphodiesterase class II)
MSISETNCDQTPRQPAEERSELTPSAVRGSSPTAPERLAEYVRPSGLFMLILQADGSIAYHDRAAGPFFQQYILPLIQRAAAPGGELNAAIGKLTDAREVTVWRQIPGVMLAARACPEKRRSASIVVLATPTSSTTSNQPGRSVSAFLDDNAVQRLCGELKLDVQQLAAQAASIPACCEASLRAQTQLISILLKDQVRLDGVDAAVANLSNELSNTYEELSLIYQVSSGMRITRRADDFFKQVCLDVLEVLGVGGIGVSIGGHNGRKQPPVLYGPLTLPMGAVQRLSDQMMARFGSANSPLLINDPRKDPSLEWLAPEVRSLLAVPLQRQDQVLGFFFALNKREGEFDSQDSKLLASIANESAIYLENAMLFDDVRGLLMGLLHSLTSAVDAKDTYTHGHSERVAALGRALALEAGLGEAYAERVYMAGLLHDVGKIGVPEAVLQKTGRLTQEEFEQMKKHPEIGARILADVKQVSDIIPAVLHHHERYDGGGYPHGLAGENIPLMGRLICLADGFDAMTSSRTYRKAMPLELALAEIRRCTGTQFDPILAETFLRIGADRLRELILLPERLSEAGEGLLTKRSPVAA